MIAREDVQFDDILEVESTFSFWEGFRRMCLRYNGLAENTSSEATNRRQAEHFEAFSKPNEVYFDIEKSEICLLVWLQALMALR